MHNSMKATLLLKHDVTILQVDGSENPMKFSQVYNPQYSFYVFMWANK
jgi:hypothetical protein